MLNNNSSKSAKKCKFAPIDLFGSSVEFNINGNTSYKTIVGCFWTFVMVGLMLAATIYYFIIYLQRSQMSLSSQTIQGTEYPLMDFGSKGLFISMVFYKGKEPIRPKDAETIFSVEAAQFSMTSTADTSGTRTFDPNADRPNRIQFSPCRSAGIEAKVGDKAIKGKTSRAISDFGYCSILGNSSTFKLQGDEDSDTYSYVEIRVNPCSGDFSTILPLPPGMKCSLPNTKGGVYTLTPTDQQTLRTSLRDYTISLMIIEAAMDASNYQDPLIYMMNGNYKYTATSLQEKKVDFYFKSVSVNTDRGILTESIDTVSGYSLGEVIFDSKDRDPNDRITMPAPGGAPQAQNIPYVTFRFMSGNTNVQYDRKYMKLLDVIGLVGGVSQVFTFAVIILYAWYNGIRMEQDLINLTVLHINPDDPYLEEWERKRALTFGEVFRYHYFGLCNKKNPKYKLYKACEAQVEEKTDITKIIRAVTEIDIIKNSILTPAQMRLVRYAGLQEQVDNISEEERLLKSEPKMTVSEAVRDIENTKKGQNEISDRINAFLIDRVPKEAYGSSPTNAKDSEVLKVREKDTPNNFDGISSPELSRDNIKGSAIKSSITANKVGSESKFKLRDKSKKEDEFDV
jgi:hypothetical protein